MLKASTFRLRSVSPVRRSSPGPAVSRAATSERPSFQRRLTARSSTPGPSLLTTSLQHYASPADMAHSLPARPDVSSTASSDNELSDFDLSAMASKRSTPIATSPHQPNEHIRQESSVSQSSTIPLPKRKRGVRQISGPFSPSNSAGNSSALSARRRSGIESEPEDGKLAANSSFLELLQATKPFLSLASGAANFPTKAVPDATAPTPKDSPIVPASALHHASPDHEQAPSSPSLYEKDIPTSFAASATSATSTDSPPNEDKPKNGLFEWLSGLLHVKVWQAVVVCSAVFATGYSIGALPASECLYCLRLHFTAHFAPRLRL